MEDLLKLMVVVQEQTQMLDKQSQEQAQVLCRKVADIQNSSIEVDKGWISASKSEGDHKVNVEDFLSVVTTEEDPADFLQRGLDATLKCSVQQVNSGTEIAFHPEPQSPPLTGKSVPGEVGVKQSQETCKDSYVVRPGEGYPGPGKTRTAAECNLISVKCLCCQEVGHIAAQCLGTKELMRNDHLYDELRDCDLKPCDELQQWVKLLQGDKLLPDDNVMPCNVKCDKLLPCNIVMKCDEQWHYDFPLTGGRQSAVARVSCTAMPIGEKHERCMTVNGKLVKVLLDAESWVTRVRAEVVDKIDSQSQAGAMQRVLQEYPLATVQFGTSQGLVTHLGVRVVPHLSHEAVLGKDFPVFWEVWDSPQSGPVSKPWEGKVANHKKGEHDKQVEAAQNARQDQQPELSHQLDKERQSSAKEMNTVQQQGTSLTSEKRKLSGQLGDRKRATEELRKLVAEVERLRHQLRVEHEKGRQAHNRREHLVQTLKERSLSLHESKIEIQRLQSIKERLTKENKGLRVELEKFQKQPPEATGEKQEPSGKSPDVCEEGLRKVEPQGLDGELQKERPVERHAQGKRHHQPRQKRPKLQKRCEVKPSGPGYQYENGDPRFESRCFVASHHRGHVGERPCRGEERGKGFSLRQARQANEQARMEHMEVPKEKRSFLCFQCGKSFRKRKRLRRHWRVHADHGVPECNLCPRKCSDAAWLKRCLRPPTREPYPQKMHE